jgi:fructose-1,6-bisphosphatase/sedoheptulose 1,7-bisphosphatase-like protein
VITYINYKGDILSFSVDVYVNPLVLMSDGRHKINLNYPVEDAIKTYLKNLPFNGEFDVQKFEAAILATEGVLKLKQTK